MEPPGDLYRAGIAVNNCETWAPLPIGTPRCSVIRALESIDAHMGGVAEARDIYVYSIEVITGSTAETRETLSAWSIDLRGTPPWRPGGNDGGNKDAGIRPESINHIRHIVEIRSGEWRSASNTPQSPSKSSVGKGYP